MNQWIQQIVIFKTDDEKYRKYQVKTLSPVEKDYLDTIMALEQKITKQGGKA